MLRRLAFFTSIALATLGTGAFAAETDCAYDPARSKLSRIVAVDSTNGPIYGQILNDQENRLQSRSLVLNDHEVILTFDDGPSPGNTNQILDTLDKHCVKATFFSVGRMALASPKTIQEVYRRGHTVGTHTWSHPTGMHLLSSEVNKLEIERGFAAVSQAVGKPIAPFFRFPGLRDSPEAAAYLANRNISMWSVDVVSGDTEPGANAAKITRDVMRRIHQLGKGIILFHDIKKHTAEALDGILTQLAQDGFKVVHVVSNTYYQQNPELIAKLDTLRAAPGSVTITGRAAPVRNEPVEDGKVDVMHTEWIDLKRANDKIFGGSAASSEPPRKQPVAQQSPYSARSWSVINAVR